jgi:hypothetical protein
MLGPRADGLIMRLTIAALLVAGSAASKTGWVQARTVALNSACFEGT